MTGHWYGWNPSKKVGFGHRDTHTGGVLQGHDDGHLQAKQRDLRHVLPSLPSEGTSCSNSLISDFHLPEL